MDNQICDVMRVYFTDRAGKINSATKLTELNVALTLYVLDTEAVGYGQRWTDHDGRKYSTAFYNYDNPQQSAAYALHLF
jgi:hypothetical protein